MCIELNVFPRELHDQNIITELRFMHVFIFPNMGTSLVSKLYQGMSNWTRQWEIHREREIEREYIKTK